MVFLSAFLFLFAPPDNLHSASADHQSRVVWRDQAKTLPLFVPASALTPGGHAKADSKVSDAALDGLRRKQLGIALTPETKRACDWPVTGDAPRGSSAARSELPEPLRKIEEVRSSHPDRVVAAYGEVVKVEAGWIPAYEYVGSLVYVRVIENLLERSTQLREGDVVMYLQQVGRMRLGDAELCTQDPLHYSAAVGDALLLVGFHDLTNDGFVNTGRKLVFRVEDGLVKAHSEPAPIPLVELRHELGKILLQEP